MSFLGAEHIMDQIEAALQAGMAAQVALVNAEYADGIEIEAPAAASYHRMLDPEDRDAVLALQTPAVILRPLPESPAETVTLDDEYEVLSPIEVSFVTGYDTADRQQTRLLRYLRVAKALLAPEAALACGTSRYAGGGFAREWTTDNGILRDIVALFDVTVHETP